MGGEGGVEVGEKRERDGGEEDGEGEREIIMRVLAVIKDVTGALPIMQTLQSHFAVTEVEEIYIDCNGLRISAPAPCSGLDK